MPEIRLYRPTASSSHVGGRLYIAKRWREVSIELVNGIRSEVVVVDSKRLAAFVTRRYGFAKVPADAVAGAESASAAVSDPTPASGPAVPHTPAKALVVTDLTVAQVKELVDAATMTADEIAAAIIEERSGKARKGVLRALGVDA